VTFIVKLKDSHQFEIEAETTSHAWQKAERYVKLDEIQDIIVKR
jgi:hypothetical protein